jgi:hypothetical protein
MPSRFEVSLSKTFIVAANDLDRNKIGSRGAVETAAAGQMAIPRLFRPVLFRISCPLTTGL